ncbi:chromosomal replication initiator protein DnaA [Nostocoides sp. F2B08]|uniref:chromosomal replication initiator protein DnaA n=1 Tax=Nostocoides sp. F2B08 TaxID=2653936 RepID=UPI00126312D3|nr:chromosomal replication initiator protein DnaA [Tetrasphaera sp. F2B08]KAB7745531.1 chromosomal replication initiator protein DnaA [Tetrasphaera sp. F2B08]
MPDGDIDYSQVWRQVHERLDAIGLPSQQRAFLQLASLRGMLDSTALLAVPNDFTKDIIERNLREHITDALTVVLADRAPAGQISIAVTVDAAMSESELGFDQPSAPQPGGGEHVSRPGAGSGHGFTATPGVPHGTARPAAEGRHDDVTTAVDDATIEVATTERFADHGAGPRLRSASAGLDGLPRDRTISESGPQSDGDVIDFIPGPRAHPGELEPLEATHLNPKYLFERFVIGSSNRFAHAAAVAVAEAPAKAYNPLFIYGESGLGKTHLLHAIGHYARMLYSHVRVRYVNSEEFTNDFINSIRDDKAANFQRRYRDVDVLLIDDIQFLSGKMQTQEEFFHTFNTLHNANKQVVITSDVPPKSLNGFEDRMRSRFEWGLITDVQPPDLETRIAILRKKAIQEKLSVPDDVMEFIASRISTNIRELEGALIRVTAFASLNRQPVDMALAETVLKDLIPGDGGSQITAALIMATTADYFALALEDLKGPSRSRVLVTARQIAMYLCRELTELSLIQIGEHFNGRDHTTVIHANKKIGQLMTERRAIYNQVTELTNRIKQQAI